MCYLVAKKYTAPGCIAYKTVRGKHLAKVVRELGQRVLDGNIQILTVTDLDTYAEYLPAKIVGSEEEFIDEVMKAYRYGKEETRMEYVFREVKCTWCDHVFMWKKYGGEGCRIEGYRFKPTGESAEKAKCPKCGENMLIVDDILTGLDMDDSRIVLNGFENPTLEEINQYIAEVRNGEK